MRNYMKKKMEKMGLEVTHELKSSGVVHNVIGRKKTIMLIATVLLFLPVAILVPCLRSGNVISVSEEIPAQITTLPVAATASPKGTIAVPAGTIKANPFLPYREISGNNSRNVGDVPVQALIEPPSVSGANPDAVRVMDTMVSGILFDKFNPSAILNIEGNDYLVKKGDVVNNYKVLAIAQDSVTVQLGANVYKAGIGEILTEGSLNHNDVSNLSNKFGGAR